MFPFCVQSKTPAQILPLPFSPTKKKRGKGREKDENKLYILHRGYRLLPYLFVGQERAKKDQKGQITI